VFNFRRRKNVVLSIDSDKTDEAELHAAMNGAVQRAPFGASRGGVHELRGLPQSAAAVFEDCCLAVEEALNSVYRQGRATHRSIGPLEIRVVPDGTFDKLMDYPRPCGASINQYKAPDDRAILGTVN